MSSTFDEKGGGAFHFGVLQKNGYASVAHYETEERAARRYLEGLIHFDGKKWVVDGKIGGRPSHAAPVLRMIDLDGDGVCEKIDGEGNVYAYQSDSGWRKLPFQTPGLAGVRLLDLDGDGKLDLVVSNDKEFGVYRFTDMKKGWTKLRAANRSSRSSPISRAFICAWRAP